ncbi:hypothetical protein ACQ86N_20020 [Puia sp. P3]|uniref:hypothetical protein n=1 Tax=Puia sp. P3 TaxID=3423952 RepID=UPI003D676C04
MKTIASYLLGGLVLLSAASCNHSEFKKTKSGLLYKIVSDGKGETAKPKQFLKASVTEKVRDSSLFSTDGKMPMYIPVDSARPIYSPTEIFTMLRKGDSAVVVQLADTLSRKMQGQLPPWLKKKDKIMVTFKVLDIFASEEALNNDRNQEMGKQKDREVKEAGELSDEEQYPRSEANPGYLCCRCLRRQRCKGRFRQAGVCALYGQADPFRQGIPVEYGRYRCGIGL